MWLTLQHAFSGTNQKLSNQFRRDSKGVNRTAEWNDSIATRQSSGHGVSFDDAQTDDVQLAFYFAIDKCAAHGSPYVAIFQLDQCLGHWRKFNFGALAVLV